VCAFVGGQGADHVALRVENRADAGKRARIIGIEIDRLAVVLEGTVVLPCLLLDAGQVSIQESGIRRGRDRLLINRRRLVPASRVGGRLGAAEHVLRGAEPQHVDAAAQLGERGILRQRRFKVGERIFVAIELKQHAAAADQRRHVRRVRLQRAIESRHRILLVAARHQQVGHRRFRWIERGLLLERRREFALGVAVIVELQVRPTAIEPRFQIR
jgi:hypothetical protein